MNGVEYKEATKYIMSWVKVGGTLKHNGEGFREFRNWLETQNICSQMIDDIISVAMNSDLELEISALKYIKFCFKEES